MLKWADAPSAMGSIHLSSPFISVSEEKIYLLSVKGLHASSFPGGHTKMMLLRCGHSNVLSEPHSPFE